MAELQLKSWRFRVEREDDWRRLEALLRKAESKSASALTDEEILAMPVLYRSALSSLSVARATSLDRGLVEYLENLSTRAYFFVYGARSTLGSRLQSFFARDWPRTIAGLWRETLASFALLAIGVIAGYVLTGQDPDWFYSFIPAGMAGGRDPTASTESLRATLYGADHDGLSVFATFLFTHNAQVALLAFALGFAFCLPSALLVAYQGATLGAFVWLFVNRGLGFEAIGWLAIHGVTELFAIVLAGAAGIRIGWATAFPGERPRLEAAAAAGKTAGVAMGGVVAMLFVAGMLEGFGRQLITLDLARYGVAAATAVMWGLYFYWPRRREALDGAR
ncbi:stage II sporulation protein M [Caulobacter sp. 17J80-11]|uniref:stage II sporulation protein M n=1 Tax=Caulobacter sp. 17J80-11 TaxID=2763502 RepID=UPI001653BE38|nr:stage II sporulation protein M [Caulobacter sp. 17J80-11]